MDLINMQKSMDHQDQPPLPETKMIRQISEEGVRFKSPYDGDMINLTPERSIAIQNDLGADILMAFDECPPATATVDEVSAATARTTRWARLPWPQLLGPRRLGS